MNRLERAKASLQPPIRRGPIVALGIAMLAALSGLCVWTCAVYEQALMTDARTRVELLAATHARALSEALASRLALLRGLQAFAAAELDGEDALDRLGARFPLYVAPLMQTQDGIRNFSIAPGAIQRWVYPLAGNEAVIGHDLLQDKRPEVVDGVRRALEGDDIALTGPYQLRQGGLGLVARIAIRRNGQTWGVAAMVLDLPPLLAAAGLGGDSGKLDIALVDQDGKVFIGNGGVLAQQPVMSNVRLPGTEWHLAAVPRVGWEISISEEIWRVRLAAFALAAVLLLGFAYLLRYEARAALLASERRFRDLADISADWFWEMDAGLRLTYCSQSFWAIGDVDPGAMLGQPFGELASRHIRCVEDLGRVMEARQAFRDVRVVWRGESGRIVHLDVSGMPVYDQGGRYVGYRGTGRDATIEVAALAEAQAAIDARLIAEAESRAKSAFLARMSHELRTPLNAILGFSDVMVTGVFGPLEPPRYRDYAADIHQSGQHLLDVISDLLDLSLIEAGRLEIKPQTIGLNDFVTDVASLGASLAARRHNRFLVEVTGDARLTLDITRVRQVLLNLLGNACKFTADGVVRLSACVEGQKLVVRVADTGIGIAAEDMPKLFRDFAQLDPGRAQSGQGTGLGLSISRRLCRLMGGDVVAESRPGEGSVFTVTLPIVLPVCGPVPMPLS